MTLFSARLGTLVTARAVALSAGLALSTGLVSVFAASPALAASSTASDPVVATLNGTEIHESQLQELRAGLPPQVAKQATLPRLADMYITFKLVVEDARKEHMDKDADVVKAVKNAEDQILREAWAAKKGSANITDAELKKRYDEGAANFKPQEEVHAHHILVDSEDQAKQIISDLRAGASFEDLAKTKSKDPTGARSGGDLGFFTHDQMVPEFADAAFALRAGETSTTPVKTQFGWHVIRVDEHRMTSVPSFDDPNFKAYLRQQIGQENVQKAVMALRSKAKIDIKANDAAAAPAPAGK